MSDRIKYYSQNDLCYGLCFDRIETIEIKSMEEVTINDAIEFYEINLYFNDGIKLNTWGDTEIQYYTNKNKNLISLCYSFFNKINDSNVIDLYREIEFDYKSVFWLLFDNCKLHKKISEETFAMLINQEKLYPPDLFKYNNIVRTYGKVLREFIINNYFCIPILLHYYEQNYTNEEKYYLPEELTGLDICLYLESYVNNEIVNTNYLIDIGNMSSTGRFPVTDELRLLAKRRYNIEMENIFNICDSSQQFEYTLNICYDQIEEKKLTKTIKDGIIVLSITYSAQWLENSLDYSSILNNFIYLFEFVDFKQMCSLHTTIKCQTGIIEEILLPKSTRYYCCNQHFKMKQIIAHMQMTAYYDYLQKKHINLEEVLQWFFSKYLQDEFSCSEIRVVFPAKNSSYYEKCVCLLTTFESILRQYSLYVKHGFIDFELAGMSSTPILFKNIGSQIDKKYIYGEGKDFLNIVYMLFSNQTLLCHLTRICNKGRSYDCFYDLLLNEKIYLSDFDEDKIKQLKYLSRFNIIAFDANNRVVFDDMILVNILKDLHFQEVVSKFHYPHEEQKKINNLIKKGLVIEESSLFSRSEVDYLNFMLNRTEFVNGLEIRNKYLHGLQQIIMDEEEHKNNYYVILSLFVLLAIKINDEFCLKESQIK